MKRTKWISTTIIALLGVSLLAGCGGAEGKAKDTAVKYVKALRKGDIKGAKSVSTKSHRAQLDRQQLAALWSGISGNIKKPKKCEAEMMGNDAECLFATGKSSYIKISLTKEGEKWLVEKIN